MSSLIPIQNHKWANLLLLHTVFKLFSALQLETHLFGTLVKRKILGGAPLAHRTLRLSTRRTLVPTSCVIFGSSLLKAESKIEEHKKTDANVENTILYAGRAQNQNSFIDLTTR